MVWTCWTTNVESAAQSGKKKTSEKIQQKSGEMVGFTVDQAEHRVRCRQMI